MSGIIAQNSGRHTGLVKAAGGGGVWNLIETLTASASGTLDFTSGIDSTYDEYVFKFNNIHAGTDTAIFSFQGNASGGSGYNETITSSYFESYHQENDADAAGPSYNTSGDQGQGTAFQNLSQQGLGVASGEDDMCLVGSLHLYAPSDTTFVKHFIATVNYNDKSASVYSNNTFVAGYFNLTGAIDEIQFKMSTGNIDSGQISLFGIT